MTAPRKSLGTSPKPPQSRAHHSRAAKLEVTRLELEEAARELARAWSHEGSWPAARERIRIASLAFARLSPKGAL
jgi:hypothetical protein